MQPIGGVLCSICGERIYSPFASPAAKMECGLCRRAAPPFVKAAAYGSYDGELRGLIHLLKYEGVIPARKTLGRFLARAISSLMDEMGSEVVLVPVPLHAGKRRQRGFNQTELVATEAVKFIGNKRFRLETGVLSRRRNTQSQIGLTRHQRRENMRGAFIVGNREAIRNREVLLVVMFLPLEPPFPSAQKSCSGQEHQRYGWPQ